MPMFSLAFNPEHPAVKSPDFEEKLALKLLDTMLGRSMQCTPEPVPHTSPGGDTRMIGHSNNFWLTRVEEGSYRLSARYHTEDSAEKIRSGLTAVAAEFGDALVETKDLLPHKRPAVTGFKPG